MQLLPRRKSLLQCCNHCLNTKSTQDRQASHWWKRDYHCEIVRLAKVTLALYWNLYPSPVTFIWWVRVFSHRYDRMPKTNNFKGEWDSWAHCFRSCDPLWECGEATLLLGKRKKTKGLRTPTCTTTVNKEDLILGPALSTYNGFYVPWPRTASASSFTEWTIQNHAMNTKCLPQLR